METGLIDLIDLIRPIICCLLLLVGVCVYLFPEHGIVRLVQSLVLWDNLAEDVGRTPTTVVGRADCSPRTDLIVRSCDPTDAGRPHPRGPPSMASHRVAG